MDISEAVNKIKGVKPSNVRMIPQAGENPVDGLHQVELLEGGGWRTIISGLPKTTAEDLIKQALNKVLLG